MYMIYFDPDIVSKTHGMGAVINHKSIQHSTLWHCSFGNVVMRWILWQAPTPNAEPMWFGSNSSLLGERSSRPVLPEESHSDYDLRCWEMRRPYCFTASNWYEKPMGWDFGTKWYEMSTPTSKPGGKQLCDALEYLELVQQPEARINPKNKTVVRIKNTDQSLIWMRLREVFPKIVSYNGQILQADGAPCITSLDLDEAMLQTRQFWFDTPCSDDPQWTERGWRGQRSPNLTEPHLASHVVLAVLLTSHGEVHRLEGAVRRLQVELDLCNICSRRSQTNLRGAWTSERQRCSAVVGMIT